MEISHLSAQLWLNSEAEDFEACIELAGQQVDSWLEFADAWDQTVAAQRDLVDVPSRTRAGVVHTVDTRRQLCSCEAAQHGRKCWHLEAARKAA